MMVLPNQIYPYKLNGASHELVYESCQKIHFSLNQPCLPNQQLISSGILQSLGRHMTSCHLRPVEFVIQFRRLLLNSQTGFKKEPKPTEGDRKWPQGCVHVWVGGGNWTTPTQAMGGHLNSTYTGPEVSSPHMWNTCVLKAFQAPPLAVYH